MARFYGTVQGQRGEATRLGHRSLDVTAQSYSGDVGVSLYVQNGEDYVTLSVHSHAGSRDGHGFTMYDGPIKTLLDSGERAARLQALGVEEFIRRHEEQA